jgi:hypothetical protein
LREREDPQDHNRKAEWLRASSMKSAECGGEYSHREARNLVNGLKYSY